MWELKKGSKEKGRTIWIEPASNRNVIPTPHWPTPHLWWEERALKVWELDKDKQSSEQTITTTNKVCIGNAGTICARLRIAKTQMTSVRAVQKSCKALKHSYLSLYAGNTMNWIEGRTLPLLPSFCFPSSLISVLLLAGLVPPGSSLDWVRLRSFWRE